MQQKYNLLITLDKSEERVTLTKSFKTSTLQFAVVPRGGSELNSDIDSIDLLITFFQNGGTDFIRFFVEKTVEFFKQSDSKHITIALGGKEKVRITSNMSDETIEKITQTYFNGTVNGQ